MADLTTWMSPAVVMMMMMPMVVIVKYLIVAASTEIVKLKKVKIRGYIRN